MVASNNLAGVWPLRDGWRVAFTQFSEAGLIEAAKAFKDHSVSDKGITLSFGSMDPNWRVAFIAVRNQCEMWPE